VLVVLIGCATAGLGAWVTVKAPGAVGGPMLISLGATVAGGAIGHVRGEPPKKISGEHT